MMKDILQYCRVVDLKKKKIFKIYEVLVERQVIEEIGCVRFHKGPVIVILHVYGVFSPVNVIYVS